MSPELTDPELIGGATTTGNRTVKVPAPGAPAAAQPGLPAPGAGRPLTVRVSWNVGVAMRDGTRLSADVFHSALDGPRPALLARTPYNKNTLEHHQRAEAWARAGYHFVVMDVRGRGDSDGAFEPWRNEGQDGYDSIGWLAEQPWCNGEVVTWGQSYLGCIQWMTALTKPPALKAMIVYVTPSDPFEDLPSGVPTPWELCWFRMLDGRVQQVVEDVDWPSFAWHLPLITMDERAGYHSEHWRRFLTTPITDTSYWDHVRFLPRISEVRVPALHITGWYDDVQPGTIRCFSSLTAEGVDEEVRARQSMIVGPWDHRCTRTRLQQLGAIDFGPGAEVDLPALEREWLGAILAGELPESAPVRIFVMGRNEWRDEQEWPLARTQYTPYHLSSGGRANTSGGDGVLSVEPSPGGAASDSFSYDPADPVPFISDHATSSQIGGPDDYREIERREDVLVYTTPVLESEIEVTGTVRLRLFASSSALDTDFTARLLDVHPDGFAQRLCDSLVRARFRDGYRKPERLLTPGAVTEFEIDMWSISQVFLPGHRIRLEISSSAFPKFDRNLNTGGPIATETEMVVAQNTVWHEAEHPSQLVLPVIPGER